MARDGSHFSSGAILVTRGSWQAAAAPLLVVACYLMLVLTSITIKTITWKLMKRLHGVPVAFCLMVVLTSIRVTTSTSSLVRNECEAVPSLQALPCDMRLWWCRLHPPVYASPHVNKPFIAEACIPDSPSDPSSLNMVSHLLLPSLLTAVCASSSSKSSNSLMGWSRELTQQMPPILWRH